MEEEKNAQEAGYGDYLFAEESIQAIRQKFNYLTELWLLKDIDDEKYQEELARMVFADSEGRLWFISPLNGNWYKMTGEEPVPGEPPPTLYRPPHGLLDDAAVSLSSPGGAGKQAGPRKFCTHCGSRLQEGARFCRECGTPLKGQGGSA
jgi:hypothetical protein